MAYPSFFTSPQQYRINWHSLDTRSHIAPNSQRIVADSDAHATAYATLLATYVSAQNTSISKRLGVHNPSIVHPAGTRMSVNLLGFNAVGGTQRWHVRNANGTPTDTFGAYTKSQLEAGFIALLTGVADATTGVAALSAAPAMADGGPAIVSATAVAITKH